jgi:dihydrofolate reductase
MKLVVSEWMTLDGVFDANTMDTWFNPFDSGERGAYIKRVVDESDAILVGRTTYEMLGSYWPQQKSNEFGIADRLNSLPKYVVSSTLQKAEWNNSQIIGGAVAERVAELKKQPGRQIVVYGSATLLQALIKADLVDEYRILVQPIVAGTGKRAFKDGLPTAKLELADTRTLPSGVLALHYRAVRA